ncbi:MAG: putative rane protein [Herbinix sp.]|nr:putative rane protein [Herbinix sp.]
MKNKKQLIINILRNPELPLNTRQLMKDRILLIVFLTVIYLFLSLIRIGCPLKFMSGISCPGCGMTRAVSSALNLDFTAAFHYHPMFLLAPFMVLLFLIDFYINPKLLKFLWAFIITAFLITYLFRLLAVRSDVVEIDTSSGLVIKLYQQLIAWR